MIYPLLMKNYACHRLYDSPDHYSGQSVVTLDECGQVVSYVPLTNELPATEWIGGVILLSDKQEFYVHLQDANPSLQAVQHQLGRLIRLGVRDASSLLHVHSGTMAMGPFASFEAAQSALTRVATTHPGASIMLAEKGVMKPAVRELTLR